MRDRGECEGSVRGCERSVRDRGECEASVRECKGCEGSVKGV